VGGGLLAAAWRWASVLPEAQAPSRSAATRGSATRVIGSVIETVAPVKRKSREEQEIWRPDLRRIHTA
jgi:hypothetical protein